MNLEYVLSDIRRANEAAFLEKLVGVYVHGSLAFGCFHPYVSDIDFLTVVSETPTQDEKLALIEALCELSLYAPKKGLEMSVLLSENCEKFVYPTPYELHFSKKYIDECRNDAVGFCERMHGTDYDLAAHIAVTKYCGITLFGKKPSEMFADVPREAYIDSICRDISDAKEAVRTEPVYVLLNICRALAYVREGLILSKRQGGEWGAACLDERFAPMINQAANCYGEGGTFAPDSALAAELCDSAILEIRAANEI